MRALSIAAALPLVLSTACDDDSGLVRIPEPPVQIDELKQKPAALVDILWVVDNSGSMVEEQTLLAQNFGKFITGLTICQGTGVANDICDFNTKKCVESGGPCNPPDYHIGVIASDVFSDFDKGKLRRVGLCVPSMGGSPTGGDYQYCLGSNADCTAGDNRTCDMSQAIAFITPTTQGGSNAFARAIRVGVAGSGRESGVQAAAMALGRDADRDGPAPYFPAPAENAGFVRAEASLFMIFVSDEDDNSFGQVPYFYRAFETLKGAGNEGLVSVSGIVGDPDSDGRMGPERGGCPPAPSDPIAGAGTRYVALGMYSRGLAAEFRVCDESRLTCPEGQACKAPVPDLPGVCVPTTCQIDQDCGNFKCGDRGCATCESAACALPAPKFLELLSKNGVFGSICAPDYGVVLGSLGFEAAGLSRKFALTKFPDCAKQVPCCAADVPDSACTTKASVCVKVNGAPIPNERQSGWVYDAAGNAVFFDGAYVPPTDATLTVSYNRAPGMSALSCDANLQ